jgi:hypothetical protein
MVQSSWQILAFGIAGGGIVAGLGFPISMIQAGGALRKAALVDLIKNVPWWTGLVTALIKEEWGAFGLGVFISLVIHFLLQSWSRERLIEEPRAKTNADVKRRLAVLPDDEH